MRRGFTLVELLVVIGMIALIGGAMVTSVSGAQLRAKISKANVDVGEITKAILAYANYTDDGSLSSVEMNDQPAQEGSLKFILGKETGRSGEPVPVLYNGAITGGYINDPWGHPYRITIKKGERISPSGMPSLNLRLFYPNWHRLSGGEL